MIERLSGWVLGSTLIFGVLFGALIWVLARMMERKTFFGERADDVSRLADTLVSHLRRGDFAGADRVLAHSPSLEAAVVRPALAWLDGGPAAVEAAIDARRIELRRELEGSISSLGLIGRQAPWVGLIGIIVGLVETLRLLDYAQGKDAAVALARGISSGLISAGAGVIVGSISMVAYQVFFDKIAYTDSGVSILSNRLLALLRFNRQLAQEFGFANGHDRRAEAEIEDDEDDPNRPIPLTELD